MERTPYVAPEVRLLPVQNETAFCASSSTSVPYVDYGDFDWE